MPAPHPRMHGLTHVPGGSDPIPGAAGGELLQAILAGPSTTFSANATNQLPFTSDSSYDWLDFSTLTHPHVLTAGIYAMTCNVLSTGPDLEPFQVAVETGDGYSMTIAGAAASGYARGSVSLTIYFAADTFFSVSVKNTWTASRDFNIEHFVIVRVG